MITWRGQEGSQVPPSFEIKDATRDKVHLPLLLPQFLFIGFGGVFPSSDLNWAAPSLSFNGHPFELPLLAPSGALYVMMRRVVYPPPHPTYFSFHSDALVAAEGSHIVWNKYGSKTETNYVSCYGPAVSDCDCKLIQYTGNEHDPQPTWTESRSIWKKISSVLALVFFSFNVWWILQVLEPSTRFYSKLQPEMSARLECNCVLPPSNTYSDRGRRGLSLQVKILFGLFPASHSV